MQPKNPESIVTVAPARRRPRPLWLLALATAVVLSANLVHARGGSAGGAGTGAGSGGGSLHLHGGNRGLWHQGQATPPSAPHREMVRERHEHRYGSGSADLVRGRPGCGLGGPCQSPAPSSTKRPDYGHRE